MRWSAVANGDVAGVGLVERRISESILSSKRSPSGGRSRIQQEALMADRAQRAKGKAQETKGRIKREAGIASGRPATETRGAAEELKGMSRNTVGKARSAVKKKTR